MKFSYNWISKFVDIQKTPDELGDILSLKTAEVESVEDVQGDKIMEIKILYNRADLLGQYGMAREISALLGLKLKSVNESVQENPDAKTTELLKVRVADKELCPRYAVRVIQGIKVEESPTWLKQALESLGLRSINNIVDATNYVMLELGQPLHAFDYEKISGKQIIVRHAHDGETLKVLDEANTEHKLSSDMLVIADAEKPLAIAGIKGGADSGITEATHTIVLESAHFNSTNIRATSDKLKLRTDASIRFSYGLDPNLARLAIDRLAILIQELAGGRMTESVIDTGKDVKPWKVKIKKSYINSVLGIDVPVAAIKASLSSLGMEITGAGDALTITVPTHRRDIQSPADIVEEVARIYGYENIPSIPPRISAFPESHGVTSDLYDVEEHVRARNLIRTILKGLGFNETLNYSFIGDQAREAFNVGDALELENPFSQYYRYMRPSLIPNLVLAAEKNLRFYNTIRLFEFGDVFSLVDDGVYEREQLAGVVVAKKSFIDLKGSVESLLEQLGIDDYSFNEAVDEAYAAKYWYHPGRVATIKVRNTVIGIIGDLHPVIKNRLGIKPTIEVAQFSFNMKALVREIEEEREFEPIPKFPAITRDISLLTDTKVKIASILNLIEDTDKDNIVEDVDVFDIFEGDSTLPEDTKSIAFRVVYRAKDHTLTDGEVEQLERGIKQALIEQLAVEIR